MERCRNDVMCELLQEIESNGDMSQCLSTHAHTLKPGVLTENRPCRVTVDRISDRYIYIIQGSSSHNKHILFKHSSMYKI